jgi:undecaprenyl-diphosphatase
VSILEAIFIGVLQGLTEFLPVSSSGHLVLLPALFGWQEPGLTAIAVAHLGTLLAVVVYFWADLWGIATAVLLGIRDRDPLGATQSRLGWYIVLGSIPVVIVALLFKDFFEALFTNPTSAAAFLLVTAGLLLFGEYQRTGLNTLEKLSWQDSLIIGFFQAAALVPGISRSGSTIAGGLLRGLNRETAARFSFVLGVPAILGAGLLELANLFTSGDLASQAMTLTITFVTAFLTGYACIHFLLNWVKSRSLIPFAIYCATLGTFSLFYFGLGG